MRRYKLDFFRKDQTELHQNMFIARLFYSVSSSLF